MIFDWLEMCWQKLKMADPAISLSSEQTATFIDLFEAQKCLWNPINYLYRDKSARQQAKRTIAEAMVDCR